MGSRPTARQPIRGEFVRDEKVEVKSLSA